VKLIFEGNAGEIVFGALGMCLILSKMSFRNMAALVMGGALWRRRRGAAAEGAAAAGDEEGRGGAGEGEEGGGGGGESSFLIDEAFRGKCSSLA
jgi:hypothetical protein